VTFSPLAVNRRTLAATLLLVTAGCGTKSHSPFAGPAEGAGEQIQVRIENRNFNDATVHAFRGGERVRLGTATGKTDEDFRIRWNSTLLIEFEINLVGGGSCRVRSMTVDPGDRVWVRIPIEIFGSECIAGKS
jgi:hypothetical protein